MHISRSNNIVITMGDPAGIGPEVILKALASSKIKGLANFLVIGDAFVIERVGRKLGIKLNAPLFDLANIPANKFSYGMVKPVFGRASLEYIDKAMELLEAGAGDCLVTAPINKAAINAAGFHGFEGHTEYLAKNTNTKDCAMMFIGEKLKITLATRHVALKDIDKRLTKNSVYKTILITDKYLKEYFDLKNPRIGVAGLNPHASENGIFGDEEKRFITPAINKAKDYMVNVHGPIPPDTIFYETLNKKFDAVIAMYHDQGLIPFKMLYFRNGVNLTLGLPFVRTSPDHGTAFDIAGKGVADPSSMIEAIKLACCLSRKKRC